MELRAGFRWMKTVEGGMEGEGERGGSSGKFAWFVKKLSAVL
jgi:hypothetical protein